MLFRGQVKYIIQQCPQPLLYKIWQKLAANVDNGQNQTPLFWFFIKLRIKKKLALLNFQFFKNI
jgi:hypothetical protein